MRIKVATFVYCLICNIPVCFFLCLAAAIVGASDIEAGTLTINFNNIVWLNMLYNFLVGFTIAMVVGIMLCEVLYGLGLAFCLFGIKKQPKEDGIVL